MISKFYPNKLLLATLLTCLLGLAFNPVAANFSQMGVNTGDTFSFKVEKYQRSQPFEGNGYIVADLFVVPEGGEFTVAATDAIVRSEDPNDWIPINIIYEGTSYPVNQSVEGGGSFVISTNWNAQRIVYQEYFDLLMELNQNTSNSISYSMIDNATHFGSSTEGIVVLSSAEVHYSNTLIYEKSTGVITLVEYSNIIYNLDFDTSRTKDFRVVRIATEKFSEMVTSSVSDNLDGDPNQSGSLSPKLQNKTPGFGFMVGLQAMVTIGILLRIKHSLANLL